jgi:hypothetical protein
VQKAGAFFDRAQYGSDNEARYKNGKPAIAQVPSPFRNGIADKIKEEENTKDKQECVILTLKNCAPAEAHGRNLPTMHSGNKRRRGFSPDFECAVESFP